ncbi:MAG TPA: hypothetical protein VGM16_07000 [Gammaproteobacteria bacterium]|jgi:hypothetical protein
MQAFAGVTGMGRTGSNTPSVRRDVPMAQVEVLMLFHPRLQGVGAGGVPAGLCDEATQAWLTLDVHGRRGVSELTGLPVLEDLRLELHGEDVEALLPDGIVNEVADYVLSDA